LAKQLQRRRYLEINQSETNRGNFDITGGDLRLKNVGIPVSKFCSIFSTTEVASLVSQMVYRNFLKNVNMA
jgi:hypothetical protein